MNKKQYVTPYLTLLLASVTMKMPQIIAHQTIKSTNWASITRNAINTAHQIDTKNFTPFTQHGLMNSIILNNGINNNISNYINGIIYNIIKSPLYFQIISSMLWILVSSIITVIGLKMCGLLNKSSRWALVITPFIEIMLSNALEIPLSITLFLPLIIGLWVRLYKTPKWPVVPLEFATVISLMLQANLIEALPIVTLLLINVLVLWIIRKNHWKNLIELLKTTVILTYLNINIIASNADIFSQNHIYVGHQLTRTGSKDIIICDILGLAVISLGGLIWDRLYKAERNMLITDIIATIIVNITFFINLNSLMISENSNILTVIILNIVLLFLIAWTKALIPSLCVAIQIAILAFGCISLGSNTILNAKLNTPGSINKYIVNEQSISQDIEDLPIRSKKASAKEIISEYQNHFINNHSNYDIQTSNDNNTSTQNITINVNKPTKVKLPIVKYKDTNIQSSQSFNKPLQYHEKINAPSINLEPGQYQYKVQYWPNLVDNIALELELIIWAITALIWISIEYRYIRENHKIEKLKHPYYYIPVDDNNSVIH